MHFLFFYSILFLSTNAKNLVIHGENGSITALAVGN